MRKTYRILRVVMIGVGVLAALLLALHFSLPRFINSEAMQRRIKDAVAEQTGGVLEFRQIRVSVLPLPHVGMREVVFSIPDRLGGTIEAISAYPEWRSLLTGKIRLSRIRVKEPRFRIDLSKAGEAGTDQEAPLPSIKERVSSLAVPVPPAVQGLSGKIKNGSIELTEAGKPVLSFQGIDLKLELDPSEVSFRLNAGSSLWEKMSAKGTFDPSKLKGKGRIDLVRFRPEALAGFLSPESARTLSEAEVNGRISFEVDGPEHLKAEIVGSLPRLVLTREGRTVNASARKLEAAFQMEKDRTTLSLTRLILDQPSGDATGGLRWEHAPPSVHLNLEGKNIDLSSAKEAVLAFTKGVPRMKEICDTVKAGALVTVSYQAQGGSFRDLWKIENMRIEGVFEKGRAALPKSDLEVTHIRGGLGISDGVFRAENLNARVGKSRVTGGRLEVNLSEPGIPYIMDISVDADVGELRPELMRYLHDGTLKNELSRLTKLEGKTKVKIGVRKAGGPVEMKLEASGFRLVGNHGEVPYPIEIDGARFLLYGSRAEVDNVNVKVGRSTVSGLFGILETKKGMQAKLTSGRSRISLDEIFPWLSKYDGVKEALQPIASMKGNVILSSFDLEGPIKKPRQWHFKTEGKADEAEVRLKGTKDRIRLSRARFDATREAGRGRISVREAKAAFLDASVTASGHVDYGTGGVGQINFQFDGRGEAKSIRRIFDFIKIPPAMDVRPPVSVSDGRIQWRKGNQTSVAGNFTIADGPVVAVDLNHTPERLNIRRLHVRDEASDAVMRLDLQGREAVFEFKGHFEKSTADLILADSQVPHSWIKGDFSARLFLDRPLESRVTGVLEGKDVMVPVNVGAPLVVNRMALEADEDHVRIKTGRVTWGDMKMGLDGDLHFSETGFLIHANVTSDELDLTRMEQMLGAESIETGGPEGDKGSVRDLPLHGVIRLRAGILKHESMTLEPFHADIVFAEELLHVTTRDVRMCGISFPGELDITREGISLDIRPEAKDQDLEPTVRCLSQESSKVTGRFDFKGRVTGKAKPDKLVESLRGNFHISARNGKYEKHMIMSRILEFLSVIEFIKGNVPSLEKEGFEYNSASADVTLMEGGKLQGTAVMDGVTMNMGAEGEVDLLRDQLDLTVLVAPMQTTDWFIQRLPLIGHLLGGSLVSIPIRITGPWEDPTMMAVPPSSVGAGLVGIMTRTFKLPVKIVDPVIQDEKQESGSSGPGNLPR